MLREEEKMQNLQYNQPGCLYSMRYPDTNSSSAPQAQSFKLLSIPNSTEVKRAEAGGKLEVSF